MVTDDYPNIASSGLDRNSRAATCFEIFPGNFSGETTWQNAGSAYVREGSLRTLQRNRSRRRSALRLVRSNAPRPARLIAAAQAHRGSGGRCRPLTCSRRSARGVRQLRESYREATRSRTGRRRTCRIGRPSGSSDCARCCAGRRWCRRARVWRSCVPCCMDTCRRHSARRAGSGSTPGSSPGACCRAGRSREGEVVLA